MADVTPLSNALGMSNDDPQKVLRDVTGALTYEPRTEGGKNAMKVFSAPFDAVSGAAGGVSRSMGLPEGVSQEVEREKQEALSAQSAQLNLQPFLGIELHADVVMDGRNMRLQ